MTDQDIVDSCYDAPSFDNQFCALFTRNRNAASPTFLGFNSIVTTQLNFAGLEASGYDFNLNYRFDFADLGRPEYGDVDLTLGGTYVEDRNDFPFAGDPDQADPVEEEINFPEWAVNLGLRYSVSDFSFSTNSQYLGKQARATVEIENADNFTNGFSDEIWIHDASVRWDAREDLAVTLGVDNLTDEDPYEGSVATPVSGVGRFFFLRVGVTL